MRVLLTGATGFVGSRVARLLVAAGHDVHAVVREGADLRRVADVASSLRLVRADLDDDGATAALVRESRPELCVHPAWYAVPGKYLTARENLASAAATLRLADHLAATGCRRLVGVGTCLEYRLVETALREDGPVEPTFPYAAAKAGTYLALSRVPGIEVAWARLFSMYGPWEDERRLVPAIVRALAAGRDVPCTSGTIVRDYLHVDDVASGICAVALGSLVGPVNVASGVPVRVADVALLTGELCGRREGIKLGELPSGPNDSPAVYADVGRLAGTGWSPRFDLRSGLEDTIAWWSRSPGAP